MVLTVFPFTAFAAEIDYIEYECREPVVTYFETNGEWRYETNSETEQFFYYFGCVGYGQGDTLTVYYEGGGSAVYVGEYDEAGFKLVNQDDDSDVIRSDEIDVRDEQQETHWNLGSENYYYFEYAGKRAPVQVTIEENPYASISYSAANVYTVFEYSHGEWKKDNDDNDYFCYDSPGFSDGDILELQLKTGDAVTYTYNMDDFYDTDGNPLPDKGLYTVSNEDNNAWTVGGENNYYYVEYMGMKSKPVYVNVIENPVSAIEINKVNPVEYVEGTNMYYDGWDKKYYYNNPEFELGDELILYDKDKNPTTYTYYYEDYESTWAGRFVAEGKDDIAREDVRINTDQRETPWEVGEHDCSVEYAGFTATFKVTIIENPVYEITFEKANEVVYYEGANMRYDYLDDAYYYENPRFETGDKLTVFDKNGNGVVYTYNNNYDFVDKNGEVLEGDLNIGSDQRDTPWEKDAENKAYVEYEGRKAYFTVSIVANPVESIAYTAVERNIIENGNGYFDSVGDDTFFRYKEPNAQEGDVLSVTYNDGRGTVDYVAEIDYDTYRMVFVAQGFDPISEEDVYTSSNQEENHWTVGGENYYTVTYLGATANVPVTVYKNPVESISFKPARAAVYYDGEQEIEERWGMKIPVFRLPNFEAGDVLTVKYNDGRGDVDYTAEFDSETDSIVFKAGDDVIPTRNNENLSTYSDQYGIPWQVGDNFYYVTYCGAETTVPVVVKENNIKSISVTLKSGIDIFASDYEEIPDDNGGTFRHYRFPGFNDGDVITITDNDDNSKDYVLTFDESDGEHYFVNGDEKIHQYDIFVDDTQNVEEWGLGAHSFNASLRGVNFEIPVTVIDTDVEWITYTKADPIVLNEYENGEWKDSDNGQRFYFYNAQLGYVGDVLMIKYKNGTEISYTVDFDPMTESAHLKDKDGGELDINEVELDDGQWDEPWIAGGENYFTVKFHGVSCKVPVTVNHIYVAEVTAPTATQQGYTTYTCSACGDSYITDYTDPIPADTVIDVTSAAELKAALNGTKIVNRINITENITVNDNCSILYDADHIEYYSNTIVTVAEGVTVTVVDGGIIGSMWPSFSGDLETPPLPNGKLINNGTIIVENGGAIEADFDTNNGTVVINAGGEAVTANRNNGTVTVKAGGVYATSQGMRAVNKGVITVEQGATMESRFGSTIENAEGGVINLNGDFYCGCLHFENDVMLFENNGTVNGNGSAILVAAMPGVDMDAMIEAMMTQLGQTQRFGDGYWDDVNIYKSVEAADFASLKALLTGERIVAGERVEGDSDTIITLSENIEIPKGESIGTMAHINVPSGIKLTVNNGAKLQSGIDNEGTINVLSGGQLNTTMGGSITNRNVLAVAKDASVRSHMGGEIINCDGATFSLDGTFYCGCIGIDGDVAWFENSGTVSGAGNVILYELVPVKDMNSLVESVTQKVGGTGANLPKVSAHAEHEWTLTATVTPATCAVNGGGEYTCPICGETKTDIIPATGKHTWDKGVVKSKSTTQYTTTYTCTKCKKATKVVTSNKKANTMVAKAKKVTLKFANVKKKSQTVAQKTAFSVSKPVGKVTYAKVSGNKNITVSSAGKITVKKGLKKGTYKVKINVKAAGNATTKAKTTAVIVTIVIK